MQTSMQHFFLLEVHRPNTGSYKVSRIFFSILILRKHDKYNL